MFHVFLARLGSSVVNTRTSCHGARCVGELNFFHNFFCIKKIRNLTLQLAILHANVGYEIGANILQSLISNYTDLYNQTSHLDDIENKMLDNYLQVRPIISQYIWLKIKKSTSISDCVANVRFSNSMS